MSAQVMEHNLLHELMLVEHKNIFLAKSRAGGSAAMAIAALPNKMENGC